MRQPLRVLIVEDSEDDALLTVHELHRGGYEPAFERVETPEELREVLKAGRWDVVISDYVMPRFCGLDALRIVKECGLDLPFIVVSGKIGEETAVAAMKAGAHDYILKGRLARLAPAVKRELEEAEVRRQRRRAERELRLAYDTTIEGWSRALDLRDQETEGHSRRVAEMTVRIADALGIDQESQVLMRRGALLHDIGKMGIPDQVLLKPGSLSEAEWEVMRRHPQIARELLFPITFLRPAVEIPYCHHEKWDGSGYPRGVRGEEIPLAARIFAVVDVWDALRSDRPYRPAWPREKVREHLAEQAGRHFDPKISEVFLGLEW